HTARSVCAQVGAAGAAVLAGRLETALRERRPLSEIEPLRREFGEAFDRLIRAVERSLADQPEDEGP
ncbi:MAG: hypothetical protein RIS35_1360, partial [Pseudomonadota bacterium]